MAKKGSIYRTHTQEFKTSIVEQHLHHGVSIVRLAAEHQIEPRLIRSWRTAYLEQGTDGLKPKVKGKAKGTIGIGRPKTAFSSELERLQYENAKLKFEVTQLKKLQDYLRGNT
jgi:transposase